MHKVVEKYFTILKDYFGEAYKIASRKKHLRDEYWKTVRQIYDETLAEGTLDTLYNELNSLDWGSQERNIRRIGGLKATYVGSYYTFMQHVSSTSDFLRKTGLYADTVILSDSIFTELTTWRLRKEAGTYRAFTFIIDSAIDMLAIEQLFTSDTETPVCSLAPSLAWSLQKHNLLETVDDLLRKTELAVGSKVFGKQFSTIEGLESYLSGIGDFSRFLTLAKDLDIIAKPDGTHISAKDIHEWRSYFEDKYLRLFSTTELYGTALRGCFSGIIPDLLHKSKFLPSLATDLKGVWNSLVWLIKNDNENLLRGLKKRLPSKDTLVIQALQQENIRWLGNVPLNKIEELRVRGELQDLRDIIGKNVQDIQNSTDEDFFEVGNQVRYNLEQAIKKHDAEVKELDEKYRRIYRVDVGSIMVSGTLGIVSAIFPPAAFVAGIVGSGSVLKTVGDFLKKRQELVELQKKPIAMLFDAKETANA